MFLGRFTWVLILYIFSYSSLANNPLSHFRNRQITHTTLSASIGWVILQQICCTVTNHRTVCLLLLSVTAGDEQNMSPPSLTHTHTHLRSHIYKQKHTQNTTMYHSCIQQHSFRTAQAFYSVISCEIARYSLQYISLLHSQQWYGRKPGGAKNVGKKGNAHSE